MVFFVLRIWSIPIPKYYCVFKKSWIIDFRSKLSDAMALYT